MSVRLPTIVRQYEWRAGRWVAFGRSRLIPADPAEWPQMARQDQWSLPGEDPAAT